MGKSRELYEKLQLENPIGEDARVELHWMEQEWLQKDNK
tara:strand:- start:575 stop:691 length:117 start_codon:yes stop_codon:yes gene_type:complete